MAGTTLAFVIAPKAMAHALLAEVPPVLGIYTVFSSTLVYGLMGMSKWLSLGTAALPSLLFGGALNNLNLGSPEENAKVAPMLTLYVAVFTWLLLLLRLDSLVVLIPPAVLSAFATTAAFLIGTTQVKYIFGVKLKAEGFAQTYVELFGTLGKTNIAALLVSLFCISYLLFSKYFLTRRLKRWGIPDTGAMIVVIISVALSSGLDLATAYDVDVAGPTPQGLPAFVVPWEHIATSQVHTELAMEGLIMAIINFILAIAIAKNFARKSNSEMRVAQELKALGAANTLGALFGAEIAGGSFSGSAILASLKVDSLMHNFVNAFVMGLILLVLTPLVEILPKATLASIIIVALPSLVDFEKPKVLWATKMDDFVLWVLTFIITLFSGVQYGIIAGVAMSLIVLIQRTIRSDCTELGRLPETSIYRSLDRFPAAQRIEGILMFRLDQSLNFANAERYEQALEKALLSELRRLEMLEQVNNDTANDRQDTPRFTVILSCEAINDIDTSSIEMMCRISDFCIQHNIRLVFSGWKIRPRRTLYAANARFRQALLLRLAQAERKKKKKKSKPSALQQHPPASSQEAENTSSAPEAEEAQAEDAESEPSDVQIDILAGKSFTEEHTVTLPAILDPSRWYLNLHDAVCMAQGDESPGGDQAGSSASEVTATSPEEAWGVSTSYRSAASPSRNNIREIELHDSLWPINNGGTSSPVLRKNRTQSTPSTSHTTELLSDGNTRSWNYASTPNPDDASSPRPKSRPSSPRSPKYSDPSSQKNKT